MPSFSREFHVHRYLLYCVASFLVSAACSAAPVVLGGKPINVLLPEGYCALDERPAEQRLINMTKAQMGTDVEVLVMFDDCKELAGLRAGKPGMMSDFGQITVQVKNGQPITVTAPSRSEYFRRIRTQIDGGIKTGLQQAEQRMKLDSTASGSLGVLGEDGNGLYSGLHISMQDELGGMRQMTGVVGITLVKDMVVGINLYHAFTGKETGLKQTLSRNRTAMARFVRGN